MKRTLFYLAAILVVVGLFSLYLIIDRTRTDSQPPVISFSDEAVEISTADSEETFLRGVSAHDNVDGDVTDSIVVAGIKLVDSDGTVSVTYAAFDAAGNVTKAVREMKLTDYESPKFSLKKALCFQQNTAFDVFSLVKAWDALDGDISHRVRISLLDESSISALGVHQVELRVSNSLGETVKLVIPVEVYPAGMYSATLTLTEYIVYLPAGQQLDPASYLDAYTRGNATVSLRDGLPQGYSLDIKNHVQPDVPGVYTVEFRVTQTVGTESNAQTYTGYSVLIVVVEG